MHPLLRQLKADPVPARITTDRAYIMNTAEVLFRIGQRWHTKGGHDGQGH